eukprot:765794-Hanusia_phi.AAC.5
MSRQPGGSELALFAIFILQGLAHGGSVAGEEGRATRYIWLMQGKEEMSLDFLRSDHSDAIQVR